MASGKRKRKEAAQQRKTAGGPSSTPPRQRDGDRRRRLGPLVREALQRKQQVRDWTIDSEAPMALPEMEPPPDC